MKRVLVSVVMVCLMLSACAGQATPDPTEVAHRVDQAVKATVAAMPTLEPQTVEVEKIVKETVIVEKSVEVTVIVEKEIIVTPTPEPRPTLAPIGMSKDNPAPYGEPVLMADGLEIHIVSLDSDAWPEIQAENSYNDPPAEGNRMVMARIHVSNVSAGADAKSVSDFGFRLVGSSNKVFKPFEESCGVIPDELSGEIFEGGELEGNVCWQIPEDETNLVVIYEGSWDSSRYLEART